MKQREGVAAGNRQRADRPVDRQGSAVEARAGWGLVAGAFKVQIVDGIGIVLAAGGMPAGVMRKMADTPEAGRRRRRDDTTGVRLRFLPPEIRDSRIDQYDREKREQAHLRARAARTGRIVNVKRL
jgi:hypothetical protein